MIRPLIKWFKIYLGNGTLVLMLLLKAFNKSVNPDMVHLSVDGSMRSNSNLLWTTTDTALLSPTIHCIPLERTTLGHISIAFASNFLPLLNLLAFYLPPPPKQRSFIEVKVYSVWSAYGLTPNEERVMDMWLLRMRPWLPVIALRAGLARYVSVSFFHNNFSLPFFHRPSVTIPKHGKPSPVSLQRT